MEKIDFKKQMASFYSPSGKTVQIVDVPKMNFLMIDGVGDPNKTAFQEAVGALYSISYTLKFMIKKETGVDYGVMPLEGLWWAKDMADFSQGNKDAWQWTSLMMQPEYVTETLFQSAIEKVKSTKDIPAVTQVSI